MHDAGAVRILTDFCHCGREEGLAVRSFLTVSIPQEKRDSICAQILFALTPLESGSGGADRTPDLGIMRPSLYH